MFIALILDFWIGSSVEWDAKQGAADDQAGLMLEAHVHTLLSFVLQPCQNNDDANHEGYCNWKSKHFDPFSKLKV